MGEVDDCVSCHVSRFPPSFRVLSTDFADTDSREELERRSGNWLLMARARRGGGGPSGGENVGTFRGTTGALPGARGVPGLGPATRANAESASLQPRERA